MRPAEGVVPSERPESGPLVNTIESLIMFLGRSSGACPSRHIGRSSPGQASHPLFVFRFRFLSVLFLLAVSRGLAVSVQLCRHAHSYTFSRLAECPA